MGQISIFKPLLLPYQAYSSSASALLGVAHLYPSSYPLTTSALSRPKDAALFHLIKPPSVEAPVHHTRDNIGYDLNSLSRL